MRLEDLRPPEQRHPRRVHPDGLVTVVSVQWFGSAALELTYKTPAGTVANELLYRHDEARLGGCRRGTAVELRRRRGAVPARVRGPAHPPRAPVRPAAGSPYVGGRPAAAPDHRRLRGDAAAPATALPPGRRPGRRQDHHGRPAHQGADRPRRPGALPHRLPRQPRLARFLEDEALRLDRTASLLARARGWLRDEHVLAPADSVLRRVVGAARHAPC